MTKDEAGGNARRRSEDDVEPGKGGTGKGGTGNGGPVNGGRGEEAAQSGLALGSALKLSGLASTGGQAKALIQDGKVKVNGQVERRRKRKVVDGDEIEVAGEVFVIESLEE